MAYVPKRRQSSHDILMVEPTHFELNVQAVADNFFMNLPKDPSTVPVEAENEFTRYMNALREAGVQVKSFKPKDDLKTPDCIFPNNWFSTHSKEETGTTDMLVLYPMLHLNRRLERRASIIEYLKSRKADIEVVDLSANENDNHFLEGTGSLVIDRVNKVAYMCVSQRSHKQLATEWADKLGYQLVTFTATDSIGKIVYHTNVIMADQVNAFCGNVIEVQGNGKKYLVCSSSAQDAFTAEQKEIILRNVDGFISQDIQTIQSVGGGGIRCMIAELF
eukprot:gene7043-8189_t